MKLTDLEKGFFSALRVSNYLYHRGTIPVVQEGVHDSHSKLTLRSDLGQGTLDFDLPDELMHTAQRLMATGEVAVIKVALFTKKDEPSTMPVKKVVVEICTAKAFGERPEKKAAPRKTPASVPPIRVPGPGMEAASPAAPRKPAKKPAGGRLTLS